MQDNQEPLREAAKTNPEAAKGIAEALTGLATGRCVYCGDPADLVCDHCDAAAERKKIALTNQHKQAKEDLRRSWFTDKVPELYRTTDELLVPDWVRRLCAGWNPQDRYGVTLQGSSNTWKTRAGIRLLEKAYVAGISIEYRQAGDLRREVNRLARDGGDAALLHELIAVPLLMVDDLGNQAFTEASEEFFLALFEGRAGRNLPTIVTTQFPADEFIAKTTNRRIGIAIARRVGPDFNWIASSASGEVTPPTQPKARTQQ